MSNWTPEQWAFFLGGLGLFITSAIIPLVQVILNRGVTRKIAAVDAKVEASAAVSDSNSTDLAVLKHQTNDMSVRLQASSKAQGTAEGREAGRIEGRDEERANPST